MMMDSCYFRISRREPGQEESLRMLECGCGWRKASSYNAAVLGERRVG